MSGQSSAVERALDALLPDLRALAADLIAIPSVGGSAAEQQAQFHVAHWLAEHGLEVESGEVPVDPAAREFPGMEVQRASVVRVVGRLPGSGTGPDLLLLGHTDVVPAEDPSAFQPIWRSDRLAGRGASDMKAGVAAMCVAAAAVAGSGVRLAGDVVVAPVSAEEDGGAGTFALLRGPAPLRLAPSSAAIVPEPTTGRLVVANAGSLTFRIAVRGRRAHGALRWQGINPLDCLDTVLRALRELEAVRCRDADPLLAEWPLPYPISVGTISGGDWASTVPAQVELTGRFGVRIGEPVESAKADFEAAIAAAAAAHPWLAQHPPEVSWWGAEFASAGTDPGEPVVRALSACGVPGKVSAAPYGSDLRLLVGLAGLPTVQYGPGRPQDAHTADESVCWPDVEQCARTLALTALAFCGAG